MARLKKQKKRHMYKRKKDILVLVSFQMISLLEKIKNRSEIIHVPLMEV